LSNNNLGKENLKSDAEHADPPISTKRIITSNHWTENRPRHLLHIKSKRHL